MNNENYWKCEYENLRRKKKEEIEELKYRNAVFVHKTLGLSDIKNKISVIIPVYNQADLILRAIRSIPTRNDIEIIVVDDCSTDDTLGIVRCYQMYSDQNIVTLTNETNMGVGYSVNRGLDVATGEYIILLGSDDYLIDFNDVFQYLDGTDLVYFDLEGFSLF